MAEVFLQVDPPKQVPHILDETPKDQNVPLDLCQYIPIEKEITFYYFDIEILKYMCAFNNIDIPWYNLFLCTTTTHYYKITLACIFPYNTGLCLEGS